MFLYISRWLLDLAQSMQLSFPCLYHDRLRLHDAVSLPILSVSLESSLTIPSMSEETHDAAIRGPVAIRMAVLVSGVVGWMLTITFCFCMKDFDAILNSPTGM